MKVLRQLLAHPFTHGLDLDDPRTTALRQQIIRSKPFLRKIYEDWYGWLASQVPAGEGAVLELGSGGGFFKEYSPGVITSDVFWVPDIRCVLDGQRLPFEDGALKAIVMTNVLHHVPNVRRFFAESVRCLRPGGVVAMIEPWVTPFSKIIYTKLHHEPFEPATPAWEFPSNGPLSSANDALPWVCLSRDRAMFEREFLELAIERTDPILPVRYLLSGGVAMRSLLPGFAYRPLGWMERLWPISRGAMFARLLLRRC